MNRAHLARLFQIASPTLPVGAFSYSQGLEWAVEAGTVTDARSAAEWIEDMLELSLASFEAPVWWHLYNAWAAGDAAALARWNAEFRAARETGELLAETCQMGHSAARLARDLGIVGAERLQDYHPVTFPLAHSFLAHAWRLPPQDALAAYVWSWIENQVMAAVKAVPLGQTEAQRLMLRLGARVDAVVERAMVISDDDLSNFAPGFAIASSLHETQYSRLFRS